MTNIISTIVANNPIPDQTLLPKMWLTWITKAGANYLECATGNKTAEAPSWYEAGYDYLGWRTRNHSRICVKAGSNIRFAYCKYHESAQLTEIAVVEMSSRRSDGARIWQFAKGGQRYFVDKQKNVYKQNGWPADGMFHAYEWHNTNSFVSFISILHRLTYNDEECAWLNRWFKKCKYGKYDYFDYAVKLDNCFQKDGQDELYSYSYHKKWGDEA